MNRRVVVLWACTLLFLLRVLGQVEVWLAAPPWLPPMDDWYSGLIPYPILLPLQIGLLMIMSALVMREMHARPVHSNRCRPWVRRFGVAYFAVMMVRVMLQLLRGADDLVSAGGIPVAFHWVLALFVLVLARKSSAHAGRSRTLVG